MIYLLTREVENEFGTFGHIRDVYGAAQFATLENRWLNNRRNESCIPAGMYTCRPFNSPKHGRTWEVTGVPDRTYILFHIGNYQKDTEGCILIGRRWDDGERPLMIKDSRRAFQQFIDGLRQFSEFTLKIEEVSGDVQS